MRIRLDLLRVSVEPGVFVEVVQVKNLVSEVGCDQHVNVQIGVTENASVKLRRRVYITVKVLQVSIRITEAKDVVPAIEPIVLRTDSSARNRAEEIVLDLFIEDCIENQERIFNLRDSRGPASMLAAIVFKHANDDLIPGDR